MSAFLNHQLTNVGWDALSTALGGGTLTFFKMQAGSGTIANDAAIPAMIGLAEPVYDIAITSYVIEGDGQITLIGNINSELLDNGFNFKELGVFATIEPPAVGFGGTPAGTGIQVFQNTPSTRANPVVPNPAVGVPLMYSYCNSYAATDYIPGKDESTNVVNTVQVTIKIDDVQPIINITPGEFGFAVTNIGAPTVGPGVWSYTNANIAYLKRLVAGAGMALSENANTITLATKQSLLTNDLDLYVANGNPDISPHFSTIQNAINYLGTFLIPTTIKARIHVSRGYYAMPGINGEDEGLQYHTYLDHAQAQQITIQGPQNNTVHGTSISSITGSQFDWRVTVGGISNTSQFFVNDYVIIDYTNKASSNNQCLIWGFFKVTAKTSSSVTFKVPYFGTSFSISGINDVDLTPISVILTPDENVVGFGTGAPGVGLLRYIGVVGQNSTKRNYGIILLGASILDHCGVEGYNSEYEDDTEDNIEGGIASAGSGVSRLAHCATTWCQNGITAGGGGGIIIQACAATHCNRNCMWFDGGGSCHIMDGWSCVAGGWDRGVFVSSQCCLLFNHSVENPSMYVQVIAGDGIYVNDNSIVEAYNGIVIRCDSNGGYDVAAGSCGVFRGQSYVTGDRSFNIGIGTISSQGALII